MIAYSTLISSFLFPSSSFFSFASLFFFSFLLFYLSLFSFLLQANLETKPLLEANEAIQNENL